MEDQIVEENNVINPETTKKKKNRKILKNMKNLKIKKEERNKI